MDAEVAHDDPSLPAKILIINASPRSQHTCPGEMSKTYRLVEAARETVGGYFPARACFSTSPALCHWPCSCYLNYALGQAPDWMNEIYPMWVAAHGIIIIAPVHWYQSLTVLKLMMDRMVCADGGNPDRNFNAWQGRSPRERIGGRLEISSPPKRTRSSSTATVQEPTIFGGCSPIG